MSSQHSRILELLPWYVNGTLSEAEHEEIKDHLRHCLSCNAALREEQALKKLIGGQHPGSVEAQHGLTSLLQRIDQPRRPAGTMSLTSRAWRYGLAAAAGGLIVWGFIAVSDGPAGVEQEAGFSTLSSATRGSPNHIDLIFQVEPDAAFVSAFVDEIDAAIVSGPSDIGRYTLEIQSERDVDDLIASLRRDPRVQFASRSYGDDVEPAVVAP